MIKTDICIIGAGPVGLFSVFEAGLLKMKCHLIDALPQAGGQLSELYPKKPIYDIPGFPEIIAEDLISNLMKQIAPFKPSFTLGERVESFEKDNNNEFIIKTTDHNTINCKAVVIAGGLGCFEPRKPPISNIADFENKGVAYMVKNPDSFTGKDVIIAGGGDSALDWTIALADKANITLIHRNNTFRGSPDSAEKVFSLARDNKIKLILGAQLNKLEGADQLEALTIIDRDQNEISLKTDFLIPLFGLSPKLGPLESWGLSMERNVIDVDPSTFTTNIDGIFAIGDIASYPGKLRLILSGFHEAALMSHAAFKYVFPDQKASFKYTTVSGVQGL